MASNCLPETNWDNFVPFECCEIGETIMVAFRVYDALGNYNDCMIEVEVQDKLDPIISCPSDKVVQCTDNVADLGVFGSALAVDNCGTVISETSLADVNSCGVGSIVRTFIATDPTGNDVDLNQVLSLNIVRNPMFGSDSEDPQFTRLIAPYQSNSFVLANPNNYIYYLSKYDYFSFIDAYNTKDDQYLDDDNIVYLFLIPDIAKKITSDTDYFSVPVEEFSLTPDEKEMVYEILNKSGRQIVTAEVRINDPLIKRYALQIVIRYVEGFDKDEIHAAIREQLSTYFIYINRRDRIPRSDIISIVENVDGVDSVNVFFISEENEKAIADGFYEVPVYGTDPVTDQKVLIETKKVELKADEDPQLGLDEFGDVVIGPDDLAIIRGGWDDRNGNFYEAIPNKNTISSLNIFFKGTIPNNLYNKTQQTRLNDLKRTRGTTIATSRNARSTNTGRLQDNPTLKAIQGK